MSENDAKGAYDSLKFGEETLFEVLRNEIPYTLKVSVPDRNEIESLIAQSNSGQNVSDKGAIEIEKKLEALTRLYDKGIINEDEYSSKKTQLLNEM